VSDDPAPRLSGDQILALKFAAHRQLTRWANKPKLTPRQRGQRSALLAAVRVLQRPAFADGCELRAPEKPRDRPDGRA
jgi:hypothetical protein